MLKFPEGFYWGAATSSHQVEGGTHNDWDAWELHNAKRLAKESEKRFGHLAIWPAIKAQAQDPANYISGRACDHYHRYEEDFDIAKSLGHNAHRFSIEWSRIEPEEGKWDEKEIEHYRRVVRALRARGIEPFVTLWHWPIPLWMSYKGGWKSDEILYYFPRYAEKVVSVLKDDVCYWITINEPEIYSSKSYLKGAWPPQETNVFGYLAVFYNLIEAHIRAYKKIKETQPTAQVGIAKNNICFEAYHGQFTSALYKRLADWWWNFYFLNQIRHYQDFIGLNFYFRNRIKDFVFNQNENNKVSDLGWGLFPEGLLHALLDLKCYKKPIYITENGLADAEDRHREWFITESLRAVHKAIQAGVDVRGYFYWSLLDNFEWDKGFWPRFGLVEVDFSTLQRMVRPSAKAYAEIIKNGIMN